MRNEFDHRLQRFHRTTGTPRQIQNDGLAAHATKLGLRVAVDASPEPVTNGIVNTAELGVLASLSYLIWHHPIIALILAVLLLILTALLVRMVWRALRNLFSGHWRALFPGANDGPVERTKGT